MGTMGGYTSKTGIRADDEPGRKAEMLQENAALAADVKCDHCGDTLGQGINCAKCGLERLRRNQPRIRDSRPALPAGRLGTGMLPAAAVAELRRRRENKPPPLDLAGDAVAPPGKEESDMAKKAECTSGCGEEVEREGMYCAGCLAIGSGRRAASDEPRATSRKTATAGPVKAGKFPCRNPSGNQNCGGTCGLEGGLCRSCGIRAGKQRGEPRATGGKRQRSPESPTVPAPLTRPPTVASPVPGSRFPVPAVAASEVPGLPAAAASPAEAGPLTMALVDFFAECGRVSKRVEASLVLERRQVMVTVKFALPGAPSTGVPEQLST